MSDLNWPVEFKLARLISSRISKQSHGAWPRLQYVIVTIDEFLKLHQEGATEVKKIRLDWVGLNWNGLNWNGLDWNGLDWVESDWTRRYQPRLGNSQSHYIPRIQSVGCTSTLYSQMHGQWVSIYEPIDRRCHWSILLHLLQQPPPLLSPPLRSPQHLFFLLLL